MGKKSKFGVIKNEKPRVEQIADKVKELAHINEQLCIIINMMIRRQADEKVVFTPFDLNAVLTSGIKDTQTYTDESQNIVLTWADGPTPVADKGLTRSGPSLILPRTP